MEIYRGDTFKFDFSATLEDGTIHTFEDGDILKAAIKTNIKNSDYVLYQKITIVEPTQTVTFEFTHEEMMRVPVTDNEEAILEVEFTDTAGRVSTIYQEEIEIVGDVINE